MSYLSTPPGGGGGGTGTPGGATFSVQYNAGAGNFGGILGASTNGTSTTYTAGNLIAADIKASVTGGLAINSDTGTNVALFGLGSGAGARFYGGVTLDTMTLGSVLFAGTAGIISQDNTNYFWDDTNKRLGLGLLAPGARFHSRTASVTIPGTSNTFAVLADGGASSGLTGLGADNTYGYLQVFNGKPLWVNQAGNNIILGNSSVQVGIGTNVFATGRKLSINEGTMASGANGGIDILGDIAGFPGSNGLSLSLNNTTGNQTGYLRLDRTAASAFVGMTINSQSRDGIRFMTHATSPVEVARLDASGKLGVGLSVPLSPFHTYQNNTEVGSGGGITVEQAGTGDALVQFLLSGVRRWVTGVDNSDSDAFKFSPTLDLANAIWGMATTGLLTSTFAGQQMTFQSGGYSLYHTNGDSYWRAGFTGKYLQLRNSANTVVQYTLHDTGAMAVGMATAPTALLHLGAGTAAAGTGPLKLTAGVALTSPEAGTMEFSNSETGLTFTAVGTRRAIVLDTVTQTLTNKRITERVQSVASSATVTPSWDNDDMVIITAQAAGLTIANPTGTPTSGQKMLVRVKDNGTARTIVFGAQYRAIGVTLPTTTVISKTLYLGGFWNAEDSKLDVTSYVIEA